MSENARQYSLLDRAIMQFDIGLATLFQSTKAHRPYPAQDIPEAALTPQQRKHVAGLMRVNHAGEISAQGLYQGQALTARLDNVREQMQQAADEEIDHLAWCEQRLTELDAVPSYLNPIWYGGSFCLGALAGMIGDQWSLGFVMETEKQVIHHLQNHLQRLPNEDIKSQKILDQMQQEEAHHGETAQQAGGRLLPTPIKMVMRVVSKIMTKTAYYL